MNTPIKYSYHLFICLIAIVFIQCALDPIEPPDPRVMPDACFSATVEMDPCSANCPVQFDASCSQNATSYAWDFGDGNSGTGQSTNHNYDTPGSYRAILTASTSGGEMDTTSRLITINMPDPCSLLPNFTPRNQEYPSPATIDFDINVTVTDQTFSWDFGDGNQSSTQNPMHTFSAVSNTTVREVMLTVGTEGSVCLLEGNITLYNGPVPGTNMLTYLSESNDINVITSKGDDLGFEGAQTLSVRDIEIDYENRILYLLTPNAIYTSNLNGTRVQGLFNTVEFSISNRDMFIDLSNEKIYWTSIKDAKADDVSGVYRANLDGGNKETLVTNKFRQFDEIVVDHENQVFYLIEGGDINNEQTETAISLVKYSTVDGESLKNLIYTGDLGNSISGMHLDIESQNLFYSYKESNGSFTLRKGAIETPAANPQILAENASERPIHDILYDPKEDLVYWSSNFGGQYRIEQISGGGGGRKEIIGMDVNDRALSVGTLK